MARPGPGLGIAQQLRKPTSIFDNNGGQAHDRKPPANVYQAKVRIAHKYNILGFISSGTYGRVYQAEARQKDPSTPTTAKELYAIKKFKPEKEGDNIQYTGLSQSAIREMALCTELSHPNVVHLAEIILEDKCVFMVFEYCEHDLLQIIHHHTQPTRRPIPASMIKSILFQLLNGLYYLHQNWVIHRDLKPANIMVTSTGHVRIGDLGLARLFHKPLSSLYTGDKVVVTIWYRSPDLLLGARHYTPAIDMWAVGCIFAELLSLRPIFKGEETKMDSKKTVPFQRNQMSKIVEILGMPRRDHWKGLVDMPEYPQLQSLLMGRGTMHSSLSSTSSLYPTSASALNRTNSTSSLHSHSHTYSQPSNTASTSNLETWYNNCLRSTTSTAPFQPNPQTHKPASTTPSPTSPGPLGLALLAKRLTANHALHHEYFKCTDPDNENFGEVWVSNNCFEGLEERYPARRVSYESTDIGTAGGGGGGGGLLGGGIKRGLEDSGVGGINKRR
ncbi:Serine/threonine-protein kinase ssn3 [Cyphellophora attinorum]|uniref:Serine/threonine-protein kinase SSN3 n=1 Tax=Cyphellophora attinorum TaxID=1664694 RepID=A0A0N1NY63_9EURO|nr:Serine/threonine-protein kinase ssn3 [Phialophora attinorum]KPI39567.1 Serine/threonine-protein kinase ssn3 [Phialophora attinorum]